MEYKQVIHKLLTISNGEKLLHVALCKADGNLLSTDYRNVTCPECLKIMEGN